MKPYHAEHHTYIYLMVIAYWSINPSYIKYMICTLTLRKETNGGKFISVYQHFRVVICITTHSLLSGKGGGGFRDLRVLR
jgi:hypothetical protein